MSSESNKSNERVLTPKTRPHERITHTTQRHVWGVIATALRLLQEDHQRDPAGPSSVGAAAEPALRGLEDALGLEGEERTTESFGGESEQRAWVATYKGEKGEISQRVSAPNQPAACGAAVALLDGNIHGSLVDVAEVDPETGEQLPGATVGELFANDGEE